MELPRNEILRVLAVDDDRITLKFVEACLRREKQYDVHVASDGDKALAMVQSAAYDMVITDWMMPRVDGLAVCRQIRKTQGDDYIYIIVLTARTAQGDIVEGLAAGADDYIVKPFDQEELRARTRAGARVIIAQKALARANHQLKQAVAQIRTLKGLLPICMDCGRVRDDRDYWQDLQGYIQQQTDTEFTHGLCPECTRTRLAELERLKPAPPGRVP